MRFLYINGFILETCHILCMESLIFFNMEMSTTQNSLKIPHEIRPATLNALESSEHRDLSQEEYHQLERFFCQLYISPKYTPNLTSFWWFFYSNRAAEGESPPTTAYSTGTLLGNDLQKGWEMPSAPPVSGRLWMGL